MLIDEQGDDRYFSKQYAQAMGGVMGVGVLWDMGGDDSYFGSGGKISSYQTSGVFKGVAQGVGIGLRGYASGGVGLLLDQQGADRFRAGNFSQGVGYFYGLGALISQGSEDDHYVASRYGQEASAHSAAGILIDEGGSDHYSGHQFALQGYGWDLGSAFLIDLAGGDYYNKRSTSFSQVRSCPQWICGVLRCTGHRSAPGHSWQNYCQQTTTEG